MKKHLTSLSVLLLVVGVTFGQSIQKNPTIHASNTKATFLGKTKPVRELVAKNVTDPATRAKMKLARELPPNFKNRGKSNSRIPSLEHSGPDPLRQTKIRSTGGVPVEPIVNIDGLSNSFGSPHDPTGSIGNNYFVQSINATEIAVYNKDGSLVDSFTGNSLWEPIGEISRGDPIILFDEERFQWIITEFADPANLLIAVSETNDPLGSYYVYSFSTPNFPDYPKYGIWTDAIIVTTNEQGPSELHQYFIDRAAIMNGEENVTVQRVAIDGEFTEAGFYVTTPAHWTGTTAPEDSRPLALKINDSSWGVGTTEDIVEIYAFEVDFENPDNTVIEKTEIVTTPFDGYPCSESGSGFQCVPQKDGGGLDAIPEVIMNVPIYRNFGTHEAMVLNFITDVTDGENLSGIRWMELRRTGGDWFLHQEGTFAPDDGLDRYMGSIAIDGDGNIGLAYNVSSEEEYVGIRFTGRFASDPLGEMTVEEYEVIAGTEEIISGGRFGDYAHMTVDPVDEATFWYTSEYAGSGTSNSKTRIVSFKLLKRDNDLTVASISQPVTSADLGASESVTTTISNVGNLEASNFDLQLFLDGVEIETYTHTGTLAADASLEHTFSTALDLSELGAYEIFVNLIYDADEFESNNSKTSTVEHLLQYDASVEFEVVEEELCTESAEVSVEIKNEGADELTAVTLDLFVNDEFQESFNWTGSVEFGKSALENLIFNGLAEGENEISVSVQEVNGNEDENASNNESTLPLTFKSANQTITFSLLTDNYPDETTWQVVNESNEILFSGGPYSQNLTEFEEDICLQSGECYTFILIDSFGDGICCGEGQGSYELTYENGEVFGSGGEFGSNDRTDFCIVDCDAIAIDVMSTPVDQGIGNVTVVATGGDDYEYSIDGGVTFSTFNIFNGIASGTYEVQVKSGGCLVTETVVLDFVLGLEDPESIKLSPNPTDGLFSISVTGHDHIDGFLVVEVLDINGRRMQTRKFSRYDDTFIGTISLYAYPSGVYFVRLTNAKTNRMARVIRK